VKGEVVFEDPAVCTMNDTDLTVRVYAVPDEEADPSPVSVTTAQ
jgi:hypothetical protein